MSHAYVVKSVVANPEVIKKYDLNVMIDTVVFTQSEEKVKEKFHTDFRNIYGDETDEDINFDLVLRQLSGKELWDEYGMNTPYDFEDPYDND